MFAQPYDTLPRLSDPDLHGAWLNRMVKGGVDYAPDDSDMARVGLPADERVGVKLDGAADYLRRAEADWRSGDSLGMISAWIKLDSIGTQQTIFSSGDEGGTSKWLYLMIGTTDRLEVGSRDGGTFNSVRVSAGGITHEIDTWYHVVVVSTGSAWLLYVNGQIQPLVLVSGVNNGQWLSGIPDRDAIGIGVRIRGPLVDYFDGTIKDVRYYSRVLTASEIKYMYKQGVPDDSLKLHLLKHQNDLSRYAAEFDNVNGVVLGKELEFNGTDNYLRRAVSDWRSEDSQGTISAWVKLNTSGTFSMIFSSADENTIPSRFLIFIQDDDKLSLVQQDAGGTTNLIIGDTILIPNCWYHVVFTSNGSAWSFFVNGVVEGLSIGSGTNNGNWLADTTLRDNVLVGALERTIVENYFDGKIKDLRYHNRPLSADEIKNEYEKTRIYY